MKNLKGISLGLMLLFSANIGAYSFTSYSIGDNDYTYGSNGYSGTGYRVGNSYHYHDNQGNSYSTTRIGDNDYTYGSNGYSGTGYQVGNTYYYNEY